MSFEENVEFVAKALDAAGVLVLVGGVALATAALVRRATRRDPDVYGSYRRGIGRAILLSLERSSTGPGSSRDRVSCCSMP